MIFAAPEKRRKQRRRRVGSWPGLYCAHSISAAIKQYCKRRPSTLTRSSKGKPGRHDQEVVVVRYQAFPETDFARHHEHGAEIVGVEDPLGTVFRVLSAEGANAGSRVSIWTRMREKRKPAACGRRTYDAPAHGKMAASF